jgi:superfamily I DNA and RNA helicase
METPDGTQRIRGLSGSGKSTVLALKAAYVHACHPGWRIGVAYSTLSARSYYMNAIGFFYRELTGMSPNWENVTVCQAWGMENGKNGDAGMCQIFCAANFTRLYRYSKDKINLGFSDGFNKACEMGLYDIEARERSRYENVFDNPKEIFDILIIDEAQDFPESFMRLCYAMLRNPKRLVLAYDELQNFRSQPLPLPEDILANFNDGKPFESVYLRDGFKPNSDIVLGGCYGRPFAVLSAAHALAFGIYRAPRPKWDELGLLQMLENISMWNALGYEVLDGCLDYGKRVVMGRASIDRLDADPGLEEQIVFKAFRSEEEHDAWVVQEIKRNLAEGGLEAHDIMVVVPERLMIGSGTEVIRGKLSQEGIKSHLVGEGLARNEFWDGVFWKGESVPICSLLEARSNEAPMVYVVDAHASFYSRHDTAKARNLLYSAMTRSTGWVRVVGFGKEMDGLLREYERIKSKGFLFDFIYPTREQQSYLRSVFREAGENLVVEEPWRFKRIGANTVVLMEEIEMALEDYEHYYLIRDWLYDKAIGAYESAKD